jgi:hypothetical protein
MKSGPYHLVFFTMLLLIFGTAQSDVLLLDSIAALPANTEQGIPRPTRGMSMHTVESRFGAPAKVHPRIGDPPISRWDYPDYSVFFEYQHVLTAVIHR